MGAHDQTTATYHEDGWQNIQTGLGRYERDKRLASVPQSSHRLHRDVLDELYAGDGMAARICDLPANEMTRTWIRFGAQGDSQTGEAVLERLQDLHAQDAVAQALTWARLYGGAVMVLGADDGRAPTAPLNMDGIRTCDWLTVLDRHAVKIEKTYTGLARYGQPEIYTIRGETDHRGDGSQDQPIHESRLIRFDGVRTPRAIRARNGGWDDSIFVRLYATLRDFTASYDGAAHLAQDFSQAVMKIQDLASLVASNRDDIVQKRLLALDMCKSSVRTVVIDGKEEFERKATPVAGLPDLLDRFQQLLSAVSGIPVTLLMGRSPAGENATGESDIRLFYDHIRALQETQLRPRLQRLLSVLLRAKDGPTGGREPDTWSFAFSPLWQLSEKETSEVRKNQAVTDQTYIDLGVLAAEEVRSSRFGGDEYSVETTIDPALDLSPAAPPLDEGDEDSGDQDNDTPIADA